MPGRKAFDERGSRVLLLPRQFRPTGSAVHLAVAPDADPIIVLGGRGRNVSRIEVALNVRKRAGQRRPVAAAASGLNANQITGPERKGILFVDALEPVRPRPHDAEAARFRVTAAPHSPGRTQSPVEVGLQPALGEYPIDFAESEPAAKRAGPGG